MKTTIQLTEEQAKALCEGYSITINPPTEKFSCRKTNCFAAFFSGEVSSFCGSLDDIDNYAYQATEEDATEFEVLRKNLAIQFEFLKQHDPDYNFLAKKAKYYAGFNLTDNRWEIDYCLTFTPPTTIYMPKALAQKFCDMANKGLIKGLENPC